MNPVVSADTHIRCAVFCLQARRRKSAIAGFRAYFMLVSWRVESALSLLKQVAMKVICAWCENEGRETLIGEISLFDIEMTSHGICLDHQQVLLRQIHELKRKEHPRFRRQRRPRLPSRSAGASVPLHCASPWRRRHLHRTSPAQLSLPFVLAEPEPAEIVQEMQVSTPA